MKTIIYFLSIVAVLLCTSTGLLSQVREIGEIRNGQPVITNNSNAISLFSSVYGPDPRLRITGIQWSKEHHSYFLIGISGDGTSSGLQLESTGMKLYNDIPKLELKCRSSPPCERCVFFEGNCYCSGADSSGCETMSHSLSGNR